MNFFRFFILITFVIVITSCNNNSNVPQSFDEGRITYKISFPDIDSASFLMKMLPIEMFFQFKGKNASYITSAGFGLKRIVRILDYDNKKFTSILLDSFGENIAAEDSNEDIENAEKSPEYEFDITNETKNIAGIKCKKVRVHDKTNNSDFVVFVADQFDIVNWNSPYIGLKGLLMEYPFRVNNMQMDLIASKVENIKIDSTLLNVHGNLKWVTKTEFDKTIEALSK